MTAALLGFAVAATLLILAPGPDSMLVMRNCLRGGRRVGWYTAAGTLTGLLVWAAAAIIGVSSLIAASRVGYDVLRLAGAGYLIWLGAASFWPRHRTGPEGQLGERGPSAGVGARRAYVNGLISNLCNPKIGAFFVASVSYTHLDVYKRQVQGGGVCDQLLHQADGLGVGRVEDPAGGEDVYKRQAHGEPLNASRGRPHGGE